jgi:Spy/CpxP family protein refolding chaperone
METIKARREAAVLFLLVFVLGVVFGGVGDRLWNQHVSGEPITIVTTAHPTNDQLIDNFSQAVRLTPEQRKQLGAIMDDTEAKWKALYAPLDGQKEAIRQGGRARIRAILTPEQLPRFEAYMKRVDEQRRAQHAAAAAANAKGAH